MLNPRTLTAEFVGTFGLIFFCAGAVVVNQARGGMLGVTGIALANGLYLAAAVTAFIRISGAHFNPAVTVSLWLANRIDLRSAGAYIVTQLVAAVLASYLLVALLPQAALDITGVGMTRLGPEIDFVHGIVLEALMTFFLLCAIFGTAVSSDAPGGAGFAIGLTLVFGILVIGPLTGSALNPARAFGPAMAAGDWTAQAVYWIGPLLGGLVAALVWAKLLLPREEQGG